MHLTSILRCAAVSAAVCVANAFAQEAKLSADVTTLSEVGGVITFTASTTYSGTPGALGWSIVLPSDWTIVAVAGPHVPDIAPAPDATGTLEFAYTSPPANNATFVVSVRYPSGVAATKVTSSALVRANGKLVTLIPTAIELSVSRADTR